VVQPEADPGSYDTKHTTTEYVNALVLKVDVACRADVEGDTDGNKEEDDAE